MKTRTTLSTLFCAIALSGLAYPQQSPPLPAPRAGFSFPQKQTLTYSVDWRVFSAGTAVIHFEAAGDRERINASAETVGAINMLFHASDHFQSVFDRAKGCTYEFDKQTVEGKRQINSTLRIDYAQSKSILDEKNMVTGQTKHVESSIPGLYDRPAHRRLLRVFAAHGSRQELCTSGRRRDAQRARHHEGRRP